MADLKKRQLPNLALQKETLFSSQVQSFLSDVFSISKQSNPTLRIAYSGGLDSSVLLHIIVHLRSRLNFSLDVMHVHHGLSEHADEWAAFCNKTCQDYQIPFVLHKAHINTHTGLGVEAAARQARYRALNAQKPDFICLAHHQDDQAETLLLQLVRGSGIKGLAGMAGIDLQRRLLRPLLHYSRAGLYAYAKHHQLNWVEDKSNLDARYARNFLRHRVMPILNSRYQQIAVTLSRSAQHLASASEMLDDLARIDALAVINTLKQPTSIYITELFQLTQARQGNLIRWWLAQYKISMPSTQLLQQILQQLSTKKDNVKIKIKVADNIDVMRYQNEVYLVEEPKNKQPFNLLWQGEEMIVLPDGSRLFFSKSVGEGFAFQRNNSAKLTIKSRQGGEYFRPDLKRPKRTLKYVLQSCQVLPWQRQRLPLIFLDEKLVVVPNVGIDGHCIANENELGLLITWSPS